VKILLEGSLHERRRESLPLFDTLADPRMWRENLSKASFKEAIRMRCSQNSSNDGCSVVFNFRSKLGIRVISSNMQKQASSLYLE